MVAGNMGATFGYVEYGIRVQLDDHDPINPTEVKATGDVSGYLGQGDVDKFNFIVPEDGTYTVKADDIKKFTFNNDALELDVVDDKEIEGVYVLGTFVKGGDPVPITIGPKGEFSEQWSDEPDGLGAYKVTITKK